MIRYTHQENQFIHEIEIPENAIHNEKDNEEDTTECVDKMNALYSADRYIIRNVINASTKNVQKGLDYCDILYMNHITYYKTYDRAFSEIPFYVFVSTKAVLRDDFPNVIKSYYNNGSIYNEFFHINGKIEGIYKLYTMDSRIMCECNFLNGKLHGICKVFNYDDCNACNKENCEWKKDIYEYIFDNGVRLNTDDYYMEHDADLEYIIPYYLQTK